MTNYHLEKSLNLLMQNQYRENSLPPDDDVCRYMQQQEVNLWTDWRRYLSNFVINTKFRSNSKWIPTTYLIVFNMTFSSSSRQARQQGLGLPDAHGCRRLRTLPMRQLRPRLRSQEQPPQAPEVRVSRAEVLLVSCVLSSDHPEGQYEEAHHYETSGSGLDKRSVLDCLWSCWKNEKELRFRVEQILFRVVSSKRLFS